MQEKKYTEKELKDFIDSGKPIQYFSKWRGEWRDFKTHLDNLYKPTLGDLIRLNEYYYRLRLITP